MKSKQKTEAQSSTGSNIQTGTASGTNILSSASKPETISKQEKRKPSRETHYGEYIMWFLILIAFVAVFYFKILRDFIDLHNGAVAAVATLAIMMLTAVYARYSRHQWQVMDGQLEQMRNQLPELQKAANAAKESADALAGSERAWILVNLVPPADIRMLAFVSSRKPGEPQQDCTTLTGLLICHNHGRTPALEVNPMMRFDIFEDVPQELSFEDEEHFQPFSMPIPAIEPGGERKCSFGLKASGRMEAGRCGIAYGLVAYHDIFGNKRITTFCYQVFDKVDIHPIKAGGCHRME